MSFLSLISRRPFASLLRSIGPVWLRRRVFDRKYIAGTWRFERDDALASFASPWAAGQAVLVLGCGSNALGRSWGERRPRFCRCVDLSPEAVRLARRNRSPEEEILCGDMEWRSAARFDCVIFPESLYYLPPARAVRLVERLVSELNPGGVAIATFCDPVQHRAWIAGLWNSSLNVSESGLGSGKRRVLVMGRGGR